MGAAVGFLALFVPGSTSFRQTAPLLMAPILFIAWNVVAGLYTRLRIAAWQRKAVVLFGTVTATSVICVLLGAPAAGVVLWGLIVTAPVILGRLFVALPFSRPFVTIRCREQRAIDRGHLTIDLRRRPPYSPAPL